MYMYEEDLLLAYIIIIIAFFKVSSYFPSSLVKTDRWNLNRKWLEKSGRWNFNPRGLENTDRGNYDPRWWQQS